MAAKLIYGMLTSLDGYMAAADGTLVLPVPEADLHQYFNAQMRRAKTVLHGRRMYEVMRFWDTAGDEPGAPEVAVDFARAWKETPKIVFSKTLREVGPNARLVKDDLEGVVRALKADVDGEVMVAGAGVAAGYGPLHVGTDIGGSLRLPAGWCGIFTLKPSLGRIPIDPPYAGRAAGPMTRTVADAALLMSVLAQPDDRDTMSLPAQSIEWSRLERDVRGLKIGLLLDAGAGLPVDPEITAAVQAAADRFADAGAHVETIAPFFTDRRRRVLTNWLGHSA